ncbi:MAG: hypothetical protein ACFCVK_20495 [Acidimicrobiales bacterium]
MAHYASTGPSLTTVGWQSRQAVDGLRIPGRASTSTDDYEPGNVEGIWQAAYPPGTLRRRIAFGLYGVSLDGYWAVICASQRHLELLQAHGADARATGALAWPTLAVGLTRSQLASRWPALDQTTSRATTQHAVDPPLYTPTALVHRLVAIGLAPITPMTANLSLISRQSMVFDGVPWFAFHRDQQSGTVLVAEVSAGGTARRLGPYPATHDQIVERCWGVTPQIIEQGNNQDVITPGSFVELPQHSHSLRDQLDRLGPSIDGHRVSALDIESLLNGDIADIPIHATPASARRLFASISSAGNGDQLGQVDPDAQLLLKPPNGTAQREPRLGRGRTRPDGDTPAATAREAG